jgi:hypothetical protein
MISYQFILLEDQRKVGENLRTLHASELEDSVLQGTSAYEVTKEEFVLMRNATSISQPFDNGSSSRECMVHESVAANLEARVRQE